MVAKFSPSEQREQLATQRRRVDFDTYDVTVDDLLRRIERDRIDIAPIYQRQFRWDDARQSKLIESVLLGIPVPPLFMATNTVDDTQNKWEVVDGLQRLITLANFAGNDKTRNVARIGEGSLILTDLDKLSYFEGSRFIDLPEDVQTTFTDRPVRIVVLNDKSEKQVRYDLFERLNTGGIELTPQEIRECVFRGGFINLLVELAETEIFAKTVILPERKKKDGTPEEYVLRFFAYLENYRGFVHLVKEFLNDYTESVYKDDRVGQRRLEFNRTFEFLAESLRSPIKTRRGQTPVVLYEAVTVGAALALRENPALTPPSDVSWIYADEELRRLTTGATNSRLRVAQRIELCRDRFLSAGL